MSDLYMKLDDAVKRVNLLCKWEFGKDCVFDETILRQELEQICQIPSPVEVRHEHWKILRPRSLRLDRRDSLFECSGCGANRIRRMGEILNYCPNCGARMDGGNNE